MSALPIITHDNIVVAPDSLPVPKISVGQFIIDSLRQDSGNIALVDAQSESSLTRQQILQQSITLAQALRAKGVKTGDVIGICSENRLEFAPAAIAISAVGATVAPLNPIYTISELEHTMSISKPKIVFCSFFTFPKLEEVKPKMPFLQDLVVFGDVVSEDGFTAYKDLLQHPASPGPFQCSHVDPHNDVAVVLCSSGTTGLPKVVELTHHNLMSVLTYFSDKRFMSINKTDVLLGLIPFFHGFGFGILMLALAGNMKIIVMSSFTEDAFLSTMEKYKVTYLFAVPPLLVFLGKHPLVSEYNLSSLREILCGAAPLSKEVQLAVQERLNIKEIKQGYGMTELSIASSIIPPGRNKYGSSGVPAAGFKLKVVDVQTGKALPAYQEGEICFYGQQVMKGYKSNIQATNEMIEKSGWLHTGDIGYYDSEGFLFIVDRLKELIKYKGFQVPPAELEALLLTNPEIKDAAVIGVPDEEAGELPLAFVVRQPDSTITEAQVKDFVASKVSAQKRLHGGVRFLEAIPKNPSGKILRKELRAIVKSKL